MLDQKLADGIYSDYAHHPEEVEATIEIANEEAERTGKKGVVVVYEPHQNTRQHEIKDGYKTVFKNANKVFWLPTYLTREDESLEILRPEDFIRDLVNPEIAESAELNDNLKNRLENLRNEGYLIILMTAGPADAWFRTTFM